jgi:hypothetical protein
VVTVYIVKDKTLGNCVFANGFTRKYFKTITVSGERKWENPAISEPGTLGGSTFACTATGDKGNNEIHVAFDKAKATEYFNRCGSVADIDYLTITVYNPVAIRVRSIEIIPAYYGFESGIFQYSDNGSTWTDIKAITKGQNDVPDVGLHKYWKIRAIEGVYSGGYRNVEVSEIYLRGFEPYTYQKEVEATADDYDRYEDHLNILRGEIK